MALSLRDLASTTITALSTVPNGISNVAEGLETYSSEWKKGRQLQMLENAVQRTVKTTALRNKMKELGITDEVMKTNEQWVKTMLGK